MQNFKVEFENLEKKAIKIEQEKAIGIVDQVTNELHKNVIMFSPVDTGKYQFGHQKENAKIEGDLVVGRVYNEVDYSEKVEYGWRKSPVNWHLQNIGQIYFSEGADTYGKSIEIAKNTLKELYNN